LLVATLLCLVRQVYGIEMPLLYTVEVPFDSSRSNAQIDAYRTAISEVIVRVTGSTAVVESEEVANLFPDPSQFVRQFQAGPNDTLIVSLDGEAIERVLRAAHAPVWGPDRPLTLVWLAVDWGMGEREIVGADDPARLPRDARSIDRNRLLRERVQAVAARRGIPVAFPLLDAEDLENISFSDIWGGFDERLSYASARYQATSILVGRIKPDDLQPNRWTWLFGQSDRLDWGGEPEEAIGMLADALAARFVIGPNQSIDTIQLTVSGINSIDAYGRVQRYMENLRVVDKLRISSVGGDKITYEVEVQGGIGRLDNALKSSGLLESVASGSAIDTRVYRMNRSRYDSGARGSNGMNTLEYLYRSQDN
jgi:hypothetical protein